MLRVLKYTPRLLRSSRTFSVSASACADPWPLPHTPEHLESTKTPEDIPPPAPLLRPNESIETMRARLVYQSRKRGTLESDLLLSTFARGALAGMGEEELREYDKVRLLVWQFFVAVSHAVVALQLLDEPDWDIYYWATNKRPPPERWANSSILERLRVHAKNEGKVVRSMPAL